MHALVDRLAGSGLPARLFGHPVAPLVDRDALVAGIGALIASVFAWLVPSAALPVAAIATLLCASIGFQWFAPWPRASGWTVIVGRPGPDTRRLTVLALDVRKPRLWLTPAAGGSTLLAGVAPEWPGALSIAVAVVIAALFDRVQRRDILIEQAEAWVLARAGVPGQLVLVSTAGSGHGEGIRAVVDWYCLPASELLIEIDETVSGATVRRLRAYGVGRSEQKGGPDVAVGNRVSG